MKKQVTRAIYMGDVRYDYCLVFELNRELDYFQCITEDIKYESAMVYHDSDWMVFTVDYEYEVIDGNVKFEMFGEDDE